MTMDEHLQTNGHPHSHLAERTSVTRAGAADLWLLPTEVRDVVSFRGSLETAPDLTGDDDLVQHLLADLLDKGTRRRDRFAIAEALEGRGAQLTFYPDTLRLGFAGRALRDDLPEVLALLAEQLREPLLDPDEVEKERARAVAGVRQAMESTAAQATGALKRRLFPADHPSFVRTPEAEIAGIEAISAERLRAFHAERVAADGLRIAFAGDLDPEATARTVGGLFGGWPSHGLAARFAPGAEGYVPGEDTVPIADRLNLDVRFGHPLDLRRDAPDYLALYVGNFILGGNFSARLMQTVRDEQGLTYGISSAIGDVNVEHGGYWRIGVTLSQANLARGIEATEAVVRRFVEDGITAAELEEKQTTLAGTHVVSLATTSGLAARLLVNAERGFPVEYLDRYPDLVRALTVEEVNAAIRRHFDPERLSRAVAGTLPAAVLG